MARQQLSAEDAELMILEGINDVAAAELALMLGIMLNKPVKAYDEDLLEIDWGDQ